MRARFGKRAFQLVKLREFGGNVSRIRMNPLNLVINGNRFLRKTLLAEMFGDFRVTADGFVRLAIFDVQIAQSVERAEIFRVVFDNFFVFAYRRTYFALRQKALGISHSFYFIEAHCEFLMMQKTLIMTRICEPV